MSLQRCFSHPHYLCTASYLPVSLCPSCPSLSHSLSPILSLMFSIILFRYTKSPFLPSFYCITSYLLIFLCPSLTPYHTHAQAQWRSFLYFFSLCYPVHKASVPTFLLFCGVLFCFWLVCHFISFPCPIRFSTIYFMLLFFFIFLSIPMPLSFPSLLIPVSIPCFSS